MSTPQRKPVGTRVQPAKYPPFVLSSRAALAVMVNEYAEELQLLSEQLESLRAKLAAITALLLLRFQVDRIQPESGAQVYYTSWHTQLKSLNAEWVVNDIMPQCEDYFINCTATEFVDLSSAWSSLTEEE